MLLIIKFVSYYTFVLKFSLQATVCGGLVGLFVKLFVVDCVWECLWWTIVGLFVVDSCGTFMLRIMVGGEWFVLTFPSLLPHFYHRCSLLELHTPV